MTVRRQISESEKEAVLARQGLRCYIDNHPVESDQDLEFDHIHPWSEGGPSSLDNIAAVCKRHNRDKGTLLIGQYRDRLELRRFFEGANKRKLDDLLLEKVGRNAFGEKLLTETDESGTSITLYLDQGPLAAPLYRCPATGEKYFFAVLPVSVIQNDVELQPRPLEPNRLWDLYRHLQDHTQLAPAICRLVENQVLLFDGQHKAAAQVWSGRRQLDCKIYLEPELRRLKETNLSAHDKLRQMPFYTSTLLEKYAAMSTEDWGAFLEVDGPKTEAAFVTFMRNRSGLSKAEALKRIRSMIYRDILDHPENKIREYIAEENRGRSNPLTMYRLEKTFFAELVAAPPLSDEFESDRYHRVDERDNLVAFFNLIVDESLEGRWAQDRDDAEHKKAARLFSAGALKAWVPMLRDAIAPAFQLFDQEERKQIFYRTLVEAQLETMRTLIVRLVSHQVWHDPDPALNDLRYDNAQRARDMLNRAGLTANWILGGS
jgi:HNH endonuclease